jgi:uncharacterized membrane protein YfcA
MTDFLFFVAGLINALAGGGGLITFPLCVVRCEASKC